VQPPPQNPVSALQHDDTNVQGLGGSALGSIALRTALDSSCDDLSPPAGPPRLIVLDDADPDLVGELLEEIDPTESLFNVISKSCGSEIEASRPAGVRIASGWTG
jgi:glucose-6-phosphate isomerase